MKSLLLSTLLLGLSLLGWSNGDNHVDPGKLLKHIQELRKQSQECNVAPLEQALFKQEGETRRFVNDIYHRIANGEDTQHLMHNLTDQYYALKHLYLRESDYLPSNDTLSLTAHTASLCDAIKELIAHISQTNANVNLQGIYSLDMFKMKLVNDAELGTVYVEIARENIAILEQMTQALVVYVNRTLDVDHGSNVTELLNRAKTLEQVILKAHQKVKKVTDALRAENDQVGNLIDQLAKQLKNHKPLDATKRLLAKHLTSLQQCMLPSGNHTGPSPSDPHHLIAKARKWKQASTFIVDQCNRVRIYIELRHKDLSRVTGPLTAATDKDLAPIYHTMVANDVSILQILVTSYETLADRKYK